METARDIVYNGILSEQKNKYDEYEQKIKELRDKENLAEIYSLIAQVYNNSEEQKDLVIDFMRSTLTNKFFREGYVSREEKSVSIADDDYKVHFPTTQDKIIIVEYSSTTNPDEFDNLLVESQRHTMEVLSAFIEKYLSTKKFKDLKALADFYYEDSSISIFKYIRVHKKCNDEMLEGLKSELKVDDDRRRIKLESLKIYENEVEIAKEFVGKLTDLDVYVDNGWEIVIVETNRSKVVF